MMLVSIAGQAIFQTARPSGPSTIARSYLDWFLLFCVSTDARSTGATSTPIASLIICFSSKRKNNQNASHRLKVYKDLDPAINHPLVIERHFHTGRWLHCWVLKDLLHYFFPVRFGTEL